MSLRLEERKGEYRLMKLNLIKNESAFSLLESLLALMLSSLILLLLNITVAQLSKIEDLLVLNNQSITSSSRKIRASRQIEWHIFLAQFESYLKDTKLLSWNKRKITVEELDKTTGKLVKVSYQRALSGNLNFYRNKNNGYNELLMGIKDYQLEVIENCLILSFIFQNGEEYEAKIWVESWLKE